MNISSFAKLALRIGMAVWLFAIQSTLAQTPKEKASAEMSPKRNAYFGDLHLHTSFSFDAYFWLEARTTPDQAYRFASGKPVMYQGHPVQQTYIRVEIRGAAGRSLGW
jgi:hypothetical protein